MEKVEELLALFVDAGYEVKISGDATEWIVFIGYTNHGELMVIVSECGPKLSKVLEDAYYTVQELERKAQ